MRYRELSEAEYVENLRTVIIGAEGLHLRAQDIGDQRATIGYGYTFNRDNNVALWRESGIDLSQREWEQLAEIDAAPDRPLAVRTNLALAFGRELNARESDDLFLATLREYEAPADALEMPRSEERVALVSLAYNRGVGAVSNHPIMDAIREGDRAEAWFQLRYNCWGTAEPQFEGGLRKRRYAEAQVFGLYDDPENVTLEESRSTYRMFELHRSEIDRVEQGFGVTVEGIAARSNRISQANRDYPALIEEYGHVPTISQALAPARAVLLEHLRNDNPELLNGLNVDVGRIHLDPNRDLRDAEEVDRLYPGNSRGRALHRHEHRNSSTEAVDDYHAAALDSRMLTAGQNPREVSREDLFVAGGGDDTLRGGLGADILLGGAGDDRYEVDAGDIVKDADGCGTLVWAGRTLEGGIHDPESGGYRSADGAFMYQLDGARLTISNAQGESVRVEDFRSGQLGIELAPAPVRSGLGKVEGLDARHSRHADHGLYLQAENAVLALDAGLGRTRDDASERMIASVMLLAKENGLERIEHVLLNQPPAGAGQKVFVVAGALDNPASEWATLPMEAVLRLPPEQTYVQAESLDRARVLPTRAQEDEVLQASVRAVPRV